MGHHAVKKYPLDKERAMDLWEKGFCDKEIARELGSTVGAVATWRLKLGMKPNKPRVPVESRSRLSQDAHEARKRGMNYGAYKAMQHEAQVRAKAQIVLGGRR